MHSFNHLVKHFQTYGFKHKILYAACLMIFFWMIFDGILSYLLPILITENGYSKTMMGIIIGSSSVVGAVFDFFLSTYLKNTHFRRLYLLMFAFSLLYPLVLWQANIIWLYLIAVNLWGFYWDLFNFSNFDLVSRTTEPEEHSSSFGVIEVFKALGGLIAPLLAGVVIGEVLDLKPFYLSILFLALSFIFFLILVHLSQKQKKEYMDSITYKRANLFKEGYIWEKIGKLLLPVLALTLLLSMYNSFFWTIGPLIAQEITSLGHLNGLFLSAYLFPPLVVGWFAGTISSRFGKKRTASVSFLLGSLVITFLSFTSNSYLLVGIVFLSSAFISLALPSINGAYADYIIEAEIYEREIQGLSDFFFNLGWIIGPILAGFLADNLGNTQTFTVLGIIGIPAALVLLLVTPKKIKINLPIPSNP